MSVPQENEPGPLTQRFNLMEFTDSLIQDLQDLRENKISVREANARALMAKQILRSVHYVVTAQKYLGDNAKRLPSSKAEVTQ